MALNTILPGYECLMLIDSTMLKTKSLNLLTQITSNIPYPNHWVVYNGELNESENKYEFKVATWGESKFYNVKVDKEVFNDTFYGYIKCKIV